MIDIVVGFVVAALLLVTFLRSSPASVASAIRMLGPVLLGIAGFAVVGIGRAAAGSFMVAAALGWFAASYLVRKKPKPAPGRSMVRTAALEMELDHETGGLEGVVLAGHSEGKTLGKMGEAALIGLYRELAADFESRQLLEAYLDSRFPAWRQNANAHDGDGLGGAPGSGAMTKEEAYKVLGLETGAAAADVRKAHRRLMQRLHPDLGGSSFLAARINEAKDVLLSDHH